MMFLRGALEARRGEGRWAVPGRNSGQEEVSMDVAVVTGAGGLVGAATTRAFAARGFQVIGVDNDMRARYFGPDASTRWAIERLQAEVPGFVYVPADVRDRQAIDELFANYGDAIKAVIHTAAQPSHDWAARDPLTDFTVNAEGTLL